MKETELRKLFDSLTVQEKISQTVQLNGDLFKESGVMNTGPTKELGFSDDFNLHEIGSIYNVNEPEKLREIQEQVLEKSRHKIPMLFMSDVIYGFRTIFPMPLAQAGSFDFDLIQQAAATTAKESYLSGLHVIFSPMLDLSRDPRWGRVMESPGEDVYTAMRFAESVISGYQGDASEEVKPEHVAACIKHFAAYGAPEAGREYNTVDMSNQRLYNEYLKPYEAAIAANSQLVMTAFNVLNGVPSTGNKWLNRDILRKRFGFDGVLVSDYAAVEELQAHGFTDSPKETARQALQSGVDFDMMTSIYANALPELVEEDASLRELLDEAVWRILQLKNKLHLFEDPFRGLEEENTGEILTDEAKELAVKLVEKSSVLLKNENSTLPLNQTQKVAVIGPYGESRLTLGFWASVSGKPQDTVTLRSGLEQVFEKEQLTFSRGYNLFDSYDGFGPLKQGMEMLNGPVMDEEELLDEALKNAKNAEVIVLTFGEQFLESGEGASKTKLTLPKKQITLIKELSKLNKPLVGILYTGRPLVLTEVEAYFDSLLLAWYPGTMGGVGIANLLAGKASPSARLSMTFPRSEGQIPIYYAQNATGRPLKESTHSTRFISKYIDEANDPLFGFGHGKSYSEIKGQWLEWRQLSETSIQLKASVVNQGSREVETVVHVYVRDVAASIVQPVRRLIASQRIVLNGGQKEQVSFIVDKEELSFFDNDGQKHYEPGDFEFYFSTSDNEDKQTISLT